MSLALKILTLLHVAISLVGIGTGIVVVWGMLAGRRLERWTTWFLASTVLTSVTGFAFPVDHFMPSLAIGILSLAVLAAAIYALYVRRLAGAWRRIYVVAAIAALYLNVFVLVVQTFLKVPALQALAPTQAEWPYGLVQLVALIAFVMVGVRAVERTKQGMECGSCFVIG